MRDGELVNPYACGPGGSRGEGAGTWWWVSRSLKFRSGSVSLSHALTGSLGWVGHFGWCVEILNQEQDKRVLQIPANEDVLLQATNTYSRATLPWLQPGEGSDLSPDKVQVPNQRVWFAATTEVVGCT